MVLRSCNKKDCSKQNPQPIDNFYKDRAMPDGYRKECKSCKNAIKKKWGLNNKEKWAAYMRKFRSEHPLSAKDRMHKTNRVMRCRYGLDLGKYDEMLNAQGNKCVVCERHTADLKKSLVVDHCHNSKKVRGLLCFSCNRSIAILDNPELFKRALTYLGKDTRT